MNIYYILCFAFFITVWLLFNYDHLKSLDKSILLEKDYVFMLERLYDKKISLLISKRYINTMVTLFMYLCVSIANPNLPYNLMFNFLLIVFSYKAQYYLTKLTYQNELKKANKVFPIYLNSLCILIQDNPVPVALQKSIHYAPHLFVKDLNMLIYDIHHNINSNDKSPFIVFADKYPYVNDIKRIMRSLNNIMSTTHNREKIILSLTRVANEKIASNRKQRFKATTEKQQSFAWIGFIWIGMIIIAMFTAIDLGGLG